MFMYMCLDPDEYVKKNVATLIREIAKHTPEVCYIHIGGRGYNMYIHHSLSCMTVFAVCVFN